jgi:hypothetical protein
MEEKINKRIDQLKDYVDACEAKYSNNISFGEEMGIKFEINTTKRII